MITEDRVTFEIAKLLRDKGFPQNTFEIDCNVCYKYNGNLCNNAKSMSGVDREISYMVPTIQMVLKWLREVHGIFIEITCCVNDKYDFYVGVYIKGNECWDRCDYYPEGFETFEEACNTGIEYALENLI